MERGEGGLDAAAAAAVPSESCGIKQLCWLSCYQEGEEERRGGGGGGGGVKKKKGMEV